MDCPSIIEAIWTGPFSGDQVIQERRALEIIYIAEENAGLYACKGDGGVYKAAVNIYVGSELFSSQNQVGLGINNEAIKIRLEFLKLHMVKGCITRGL